MIDSTFTIRWLLYSQLIVASVSQDAALGPILEAAGYNEIDWTIHDPSRVIVIDDQHLIAATAKAQEDGYNCGIETWYRAEDGGGDWRPGQCLLQNKPDWVETYIPSNDGAYWAPELVDSRTLLYSVADFDEGNITTCVGVAFATGEDITQLSWVDSGQPISCIAESDYNEERSSIDPSVFVGFDGKTYMVTGGGVIHGTELDSTSYMPISGTFFSTSDDNWAEMAKGPVVTEDGETYHEWVEAAYVWPQMSDGIQYYYLFVNWGSCCSGKQSTYNIRIGRSTSPLGPFVDKSGLDLMDGGGSLLLDTENYLIGPGHAAIYNDSIMSYHYYDRRRDDGASWIAESSISIVNGWPIVGNLISSYGSEGSNPGICNDSTLRFKLKKNGKNIMRDCGWVGNKDTKNRCAIAGVSSMCQSTCDSCQDCVDGTARFRLQWNNKRIARECRWVRNKQTALRCAAPGVRDTCRETCGQCTN